MEIFLVMNTLRFLVRRFKLTLRTQKAHAMTIRTLEFLEVKKCKQFPQHNTAARFNRGSSNFEVEIRRLIYMCKFIAIWF